MNRLESWYKRTQLAGQDYLRASGFIDEMEEEIADYSFIHGAGLVPDRFEMDAADEIRKSGFRKEHIPKECLRPIRREISLR